MALRGIVAAAAFGAGLVVATACATRDGSASRSDPVANDGVVETASVVPPLPPDADPGEVEQQQGARQAEESGATETAAESGQTAGPGASEPATSPSSPGMSAESDTSEPDAARGARRSGPASEPVRRELIVVDEGSSAVRPSPGELSQATRRDAASRASAPRITNDNLAEYARRGQVTISGTAADEPGAESAIDTGAAAAGTAAGEPVRDEAWWRARAREIREEWRRTLDEIAALEAAAADLRWRFYAVDDPWVRDREVKPEWDRALDRLGEARRRLDEYPGRLEELVDEGRRQGALPGWLREGIELEPQPEELPDATQDPAEPVEPRELDETPGGSGR